MVALDIVTGVERGAAKVLGVAALDVVKGVGSGAARVLGVAALGLETHVTGVEVVVCTVVRSLSLEPGLTFALALALDGGVRFGFRLV